VTRTVPVTSQEAPGLFITGALWNAGPKALGDFVLGLPLCFAYQTVSQSLASGTWTSISLDSTGASLDTDGGHSNITNNSRYTCQVPGTYWAFGSVTHGNNTTGARSARIAKNGTVLLGSESYATQGGGLLGATAFAYIPVLLSVGDYIELQGFQNSGGALSTIVNGEIASNLWVFFVHN
jgi:hypothetical protein